MSRDRMKKVFNPRAFRPLAVVTLTLLGALGCASLSSMFSGGAVVVRSQPPQASVYFIDSKTGQGALIGKTPLTFQRGDHAIAGNDLIQLRVEREGYEPRYAAVTAFGRETTYLDLVLSQPLVAKPDIREAFEQSRRLMEEANRLLLNKRFSEALMAVEKILALDPKNAEGHAAKGSVLYLMKDYDGAVSAWTRALELNPSFDSVRESLIQLSNERPSRGAASVGGS